MATNRLPQSVPGARPLVVRPVENVSAPRGLKHSRKEVMVDLMPLNSMTNERRSRPSVGRDVIFASQWLVEHQAPRRAFLQPPQKPTATSCPPSWGEMHAVACLLKNEPAGVVAHHSGVMRR